MKILVKLATLMLLSSAASSQGWNYDGGQVAISSWTDSITVFPGSTTTWTVQPGGSFTVTPGTGTWSTSIIAGSTVTVQPLIASTVPGSSTTLASLTSTTVLAANAARKTWKCSASPANTVAVILSAVGVATLASTLASLSAGDSYSETVVVATTTITAIASIANQGILCDQKSSP